MSYISNRPLIVYDMNVAHDFRGPSFVPGAAMRLGALAKSRNIGAQAVLRHRLWNSNKSEQILKRLLDAVALLRHLTCYKSSQGI